MEQSMNLPPLPSSIVGTRAYQAQSPSVTYHVVGEIPRRYSWTA